jgi:N-acetylglucosaminyldiphosphoundecaprenol N-acetyl-beta-D-mannosaminyltransferase
MLMYDFYGLNISVFSEEELNDQIITDLSGDKAKIYFGYSMGYFPLFRKYPELYTCANGYDRMVTDGRLFYLFAKMLGAPLKFDISIPFLSRKIMDIANMKGASMMVIGSLPDINQKATQHLRDRYPGAVVYDGHNGGKFTLEDQKKTIDHINTYSPDIVFLGISSPKKELFATNWKDKLNVKIIVPFGGMIDGLGGKVWLTPPLLKKMGFATLVRVVQEPRRLLWPNLVTIFYVFCVLLPSSFIQVLILRNKKYYIPSFFGIKKQ